MTPISRLPDTYGPQADIAATGSNCRRRTAAVGSRGCAGISGRVHDGQWITPGSGQGTTCHRAHRRKRLHHAGGYSGDATTMPTLRKSARLWLRPARRDKTGRIIAKAVYIILDGGKHHPTGCFTGEAERAERRLAEYIAAKYQAPRKGRSIDDIFVADVLSIYVDDCGPRQRNRKKFDERIGRLNEFFGGKRLSEVNAASCRDYAEHRGNRGGARRDLEDLRAAINHHADEGMHREIVKITLPEKGPPRERWLTRSEAAKLLWVCWRHRELQLRHRGPNKGKKLPTTRYPLRHLARFLLIGLYTGTRAGAISSASPNHGEGRSSQVPGGAQRGGGPTASARKSVGRASCASGRVHIFGMNDLFAPGVACRPRQRVVQQVLIEVSVAPPPPTQSALRSLSSAKPRM
jgi:hypothetical protein